MSKTSASVVIDDLWVTYRGKHPSSSNPSTGMGRTHALQGISFALDAGSVCGVVGRNGAGKSTLMKVIAGTLPPSRGRATVRGKATLLAPGIGFKRALSGRENAVLACLAQGLTRKQAKERLADITELSGLAEVIDWPLHMYSSGMYSRLALAVALQASPDLLLVDEALSAGDFAFRSRVDEAVGNLVGQAGSVLLISHSFPQVRRMCDRCIWVDDGRIRADGQPKEVIVAYQEWVYAQDPDRQGRPLPRREVAGGAAGPDES